MCFLNPLECRRESLSWVPVMIALLPTRSSSFFLFPLWKLSFHRAFDPSSWPSDTSNWPLYTLSWNSDPSRASLLRTNGRIGGQMESEKSNSAIFMRVSTWTLYTKFNFLTKLLLVAPQEWVQSIQRSSLRRDIVFKYQISRNLMPDLKIFMICIDAKYHHFVRMWKHLLRKIQIALKCLTTSWAASVRPSWEVFTCTQLPKIFLTI